MVSEALASFSSHHTPCYRNPIYSIFWSDGRWFCILQSLVPLGSVEELLAAYDSKRDELPPPVIVWEWGWTKSAETWNGRAAMLAVLVLLMLEVTTGEGFLHQWGILPLFHWSRRRFSRPSPSGRNFAASGAPFDTVYESICFHSCQKKRTKSDISWLYCTDSSKKLLYRTYRGHGNEKGHAVWRRDAQT